MDGLGNNGVAGFAGYPAGYDPNRAIRQQLVTQLINYYGVEGVDELIEAAKRLQAYITTGV